MLTTEPNTLNDTRQSEVGAAAPSSPMEGGGGGPAVLGGGGGSIPPSSPNPPTTSDAPPNSSTQSLSPSVPQSLSPRDQHLLRSLFSRNLNIAAVARDELVDCLELLDWADRPEIKDRIDRFHALGKLAIESAQDEARLVAIESLKQLAANAKDPTDRRRAATILMRRSDIMPRHRTPSHPAPWRGAGEVSLRAGTEGATEPQDSQSPSSSTSAPPTTPSPCHLATLSSPSSSLPTAQTISHLLLHSGSTRSALERLHTHTCPATFIFRRLAEPLNRFLATHSTGPLADFITTAPRTITPTPIETDLPGHAYQLGALRFRLIHNSFHWILASIDTS